MTEEHVNGISSQEYLAGGRNSAFIVRIWQFQTRVVEPPSSYKIPPSKVLGDRWPCQLGLLVLVQFLKQFESLVQSEYVLHLELNLQSVPALLHGSIIQPEFLHQELWPPLWAGHSIPTLWVTQGFSFEFACRQKQQHESTGQPPSPSPSLSHFEPQESFCTPHSLRGYLLPFQCQDLSPSLSSWEHPKAHSEAPAQAHATGNSGSQAKCTRISQILHNQGSGDHLKGKESSHYQGRESYSLSDTTPWQYISSSTLIHPEKRQYMFWILGRYCFFSPEY